MKVDRAIFDANVLISALLNRKGTPRKALDIIRSGGSLVFSDESFRELVTRLNRPKFDVYVSTELRAQYLTTLLEMSEWVVFTGEPQGCRDPKDDMFIETATVGEVDVLVSGDTDLLALGNVEGIPILSSTEFLA